MGRKVAMIVLAAAALSAACAGPQPQPPAVTASAPPLVRCDDGGSGGVLIDGVCL